MKKKKYAKRMFNTGFEMLNKYESKRLRLLSVEWAQREKAERPFKCPGCGTKRTLDLVYIRRDHVECSNCGHSFPVEGKNTECN